MREYPPVRDRVRKPVRVVRRVRTTKDGHVRDPLGGNATDGRVLGW